MGRYKKDSSVKIVFPDFIDLDEADKVKFENLGVRMYGDTPSDEDDIIERIHDAEVATANFIDITKNIIDAAPNLKYIISTAVGYDWIDHKYAATKGIKVLNCPTQNAEAVAEHALALMFSVARRIVEASQDLQNGGWGQQKFIGFELGGKKLGLVGYGRVGKLIDQKARGLGMKVGYVNSRSSAEELDSLLKDSDIVCLCLSLTDITRGVIDERRLKLLKSNSILINVARGSLVDQAALFRMLQGNVIRGAGLDVFEDEPFTGGAPELIVELAKLQNVVATPHMAFNTVETKSRLGIELFNNIESCLNGRPMNVVN